MDSDPASRRVSTPRVWSSSAEVKSTPRSGVSRIPGPGASSGALTSWVRRSGEAFTRYQAEPSPLTARQSWVRPTWVRRAGQHLPVRADHELPAAPPVLAGLRGVVVVVGDHVDDLHPVAVALLRELCGRGRPVDLLPARHDGRPVLQRPAVELGVRQLQPL